MSKLTTLAVLAAAAVAAGACEKKEPAPAPAPAPEATSPDPSPGAAKVAAAPEPGGAREPTPAGDPAEAQCKALLPKMWEAIQPVLARVGADAATLEQGYLKGGSFVERCVALTAAQRDCLTASANPVMGIHDCKVTEGKKASERVWAPSIRSHDRPVELAPDVQARRLAAAVGTWTSEWASYKQKTTWTIAADGTLQETKEREGKVEEHTYAVTFDREGQVTVKTTPTSTQQYGWLQLDDKLAYVTSNLAYGAYPVDDVERFTTWVGDGWLALDGDACEMITEYAEVVPATCSWTQAGKVEVLTVTYQAPGRTTPSGEPATSTLTLHRAPGYLLDERLVDVGTFRKK